MRPIAALLVAVAALWAQSGKPAPRNVTAVRHWSLDGVTRLAVEISGSFEYRSDRLHNPERVYYDIPNTRPRFDTKRLYTEDFSDPFVKRIRVAETQPGVTRVVLDLNERVDVAVSILSNPDRLIVELRNGTATVPTAGSSNTPAVSAATWPATSAATNPSTVFASGSSIAPPLVSSGMAPIKSPVHDPAPEPSPASSATTEIETTLPITPAVVPTNVPTSVPTSGPAPIPTSTPVKETVKATDSETTTPAAVTRKSTPLAVEVAKPARRTASGSTSLVRALGLKLQRVVIDPGHGGHDEGTQGPKGYLEKDLVLDVALRVGKLVQDQLNAEVIYTRSDDTFIPLEGRTAIANDAKADLFLSIHANSSPITHVTGVETYYLNFTDSKDALDVASRENASSQKSVFELRDVIQRISAHDKAEESRDFASRIQSALFAFSAKTFPDEKNRGVRKAPFVVLIGANMPSILAEIGFLSNPHEELLLKRPDYRQKLAEALFHGISKYAEGLSHFQVAEN